MFLKESTASQTVKIGPFIDETDGISAMTGLTISAADIRLSKAGANIVACSVGGTHDELGYYTVVLGSADTGTVGPLQLVVHEATAMPVYHEFQVIETNVYDALFASGADGFGTDGVTISSASAATVARLILPQTNTALNNVQFLMVLASDHVTAATGLTPVMTRSIDGGAFGAAAGGTTITEVSNGMYQVDLATADTNGTEIVYRFAVATADDTFLTIRYAA